MFYGLIHVNSIERGRSREAGGDVAEATQIDVVVTFVMLAM